METEREDLELAVAILELLCIECSSIVTCFFSNEKSKPNSILLRRFFSTATQNLLSSEFYRAFCVTKSWFERLCALLYPHTRKFEQMATICSAGTIDVETKLAIFYESWQMDNIWTR